MARVTERERPGGHDPADPPDPDPGPDPDEGDGAEVAGRPPLDRLGRRLRSPAGVHGLTLVVAFVVLLWVNRTNWFFGDDWQLLVGRGRQLTSLDLWRPHFDHWSTLPILAFWLLVTVAGLHTAWPLLLWALLAHLGTVHLAWRTARAGRADAWLATGAAAVFAVLGSGAENLTWTFQCTTNTAILLGYGAVLLTDRERPSTRRLVAAAGLGLAAVMFSNVGVFLVLAAGLLAVVRSGWRRALTVAAVPLGAFVIWYALAGRTARVSEPVSVTALLRIPTFVADAVADSLELTSGLPGAGAALAVALAAWAVTHLDRWRERAAALCLAAGALLLFAAISIGRYVEQGPFLSSRYVYLMIALLFPLLTLALTDLVRWARAPAAARAAVLGLLAVLVVVNIGTLRTFAINRMALVHAVQGELLATAWLARTGEPTLTDNAVVRYSPELRIDDLRALAGEGKLDVPAPVAVDVLDARARLQVGVSDQAKADGALRLLDAGGLTAGPAGGACTSLRRTAGDTGRIVLRPTDGRAGSVTVRPPAGADLVLTLRSSDGTTGTDRSVSPLPDPAVITTIAAGHDVVVTLPEGTTALCGLAPG